jgi:hypothetical protein
MANLLAIATVFICLWTLNIYILQSEKGGLYARQNYLCRNLRQKGRGLIREGGCRYAPMGSLNVAILAHTGTYPG